jgi:hypothetical protein
MTLRYAARQQTAQMPLCTWPARTEGGQIALIWRSRPTTTTASGSGFGSRAAGSKARNCSRQARPLDASSGDQVRHRLSRAGNRRNNQALHIMAIAALRHDTEGRACYRRKLAAGKTTMEAMRCLKRRLSDVVYQRMRADAKRLGTGPGGHAGATRQSSAADPIPTVSTSDQSLPGPASNEFRTTLPAAS